MIERFLKQTSFTSVEDYNKNLQFIIPEHFNFAYDVMDAWAEEAPEKLALLWTNDQGEEIRATYKQLKEQSGCSLSAVARHWQGRSRDADPEASLRVVDCDAGPL